jgi:hypothetical protein
MAIDLASPGASLTDLKAALRALKTYRGCVLRKAANLTGLDLQSTSGSNIITWDTAIRDTDGFHDPGGANPERITIQAGLGIIRARLRAQVNITNSFLGIDADLRIYKNLVMTGNSPTGGTLIARHRRAGRAEYSDQVHTDTIDVADGDHFTLYVVHGTTNLTFLATSWFELEVVETEPV